MLESRANNKLLEELNRLSSIYEGKGMVEVSGHDPATGLRVWREDRQRKEVKGERER